MYANDNIVILII